MNSKQIMEAFEKACQNKEFKEEFTSLLSKYVLVEKKEDLTKDLTDQELIRKRYNDIDFDPKIQPDVANDLKPFDVVNGIYYNEENDSFELYPFRVIYNSFNELRLLGLKILGVNDWRSVKDKKFKFIFTMTDKYGFFVAEGRIPDKDCLLTIIDAYNNRPKYIKDYYLIAIGVPYWTNNKDGAYGYRIRNDGYVDFDKISCSYGIIPYVEISFTEITLTEIGE